MPPCCAVSGECTTTLFTAQPPAPKTKNQREAQASLTCFSLRFAAHRHGYRLRVRARTPPWWQEDAWWRWGDCRPFSGVPANSPLFVESRSYRIVHTDMSPRVRQKQCRTGARPANVPAHSRSTCTTDGWGGSTGCTTPTSPRPYCMRQLLISRIPAANANAERQRLLVRLPETPAETPGGTRTLPSCLAAFMDLINRMRF